MERILIITVGTGRTGEDIAKGIYYSIERNPHDRICFIVTKITEEGTLPYIKALLDKNNDIRPYDVELVDEINDVEILTNDYGRIIDGYLENKIAAKNITIDYTSGTKAMSVALVYAAITREVDTISYIYGQRDKTGIVKGGYRINALRPTAIFTSKRIQRFRAFFNKYQFESALGILREETIDFNYEDEVQTLIEIALGYAAWDKFDFETALDKLKSISDEALASLKVKGIVNNHKQMLYRLKSVELDKLKVEDLYHNAARRFEEGKYDDGVARLYRTIEMIGQIEFQREYGCTTGEVTADVLSTELQTEFKHVFNEKDQVYRLGLLNTFKALQAKKSAVAARFFENMGEFNKVLSARNMSILAHGSTPVKKSTFERFREIIDHIFPIDSTFKFPKLQ